MQRCARITRVVQTVGAEASVIPTYEGLSNLASFLVEFEETFIESQRLPPLHCVLKATPARWWGTHKKSISEWPHCKRLMEIIFRE